MFTTIRHPCWLKKTVAAQCRNKHLSKLLHCCIIPLNALPHHQGELVSDRLVVIWNWLSVTWSPCFNHSKITQKRSQLRNAKSCLTMLERQFASMHATTITNTVLATLNDSYNTVMELIDKKIQLGGEGMLWKQSHWDSIYLYMIDHVCYICWNDSKIHTIQVLTKTKNNLFLAKTAIQLEINYMNIILIAS